MSDKVQDHFEDDEFESLLSAASMNAANDWESDFVSDMEERFDQYGRRMFLTDRQLEILERIANDD